jgi:mannobiose 2-epimerase
MNIENTFESKIHRVLVDNILSFWKNRAIDFEHSLPYGKVDAHGLSVLNEPIGVILTARIFWAFSAAYKAFKEEKYLEIAEMMNHRLAECFLDQTNGGLWYAINKDESIFNSGKFTESQAYGIYAFSTYFNVSGDKAALEHAFDLFSYVEKHAIFGRQESYIDLLDPSKRKKGNRSTKESDHSASLRSLNTHLHLLEAYNALYLFSRDLKVRDRLETLFNILVDHFYIDGLFYSHLSSDLHSTDNTTFYGMNLETAWLLIETAECLDENDYTQKANTILAACASKTLAVGVDEDGAVFYSGKGCRPQNYTKQWWVQAEAAVAFLIAYEKSLKPHYFDAFLMLWEFILQYLVDWKVGDWRIGMTKDGNVLQDDNRAGFWKGPYHNTRACLEMLKRIKLIQEGLNLCIQTEALENCLD